MTKLFIRGLLIIFIFSLIFGCSNRKKKPSNPFKISTKVGKLNISFRGNEGAFISGIASLRHEDAPNIEAFSRAGFNYEYLLSGTASPLNGVIPRTGPFILSQEDNKIILTRKREDSPREVAVRIIFEPKAPHYIDFTIECQLYNLEHFKPYNWVGLFFANYMNITYNPNINFYSKQGIQNSQSIELGTSFIPEDNLLFEYEKDQILSLNMPYFEGIHISEPFYYGLINIGQKKMMYQINFQFLRKDNQEIRFSIWKWLPNSPAWDFIWFIKNPELDKKYRLTGRLIWKPFVNRENAAKEYLDWSLNRPN